MYLLININRSSHCRSFHTKKCIKTIAATYWRMEIIEGTHRHFLPWRYMIRFIFTNYEKSTKRKLEKAWTLYSYEARQFLLSIQPTGSTIRSSGHSSPINYSESNCDKIEIRLYYAKRYFYLFAVQTKVVQTRCQLCIVKYDSISQNSIVKKSSKSPNFIQITMFCLHLSRKASFSISFS